MLPRVSFAVLVGVFLCPALALAQAPGAADVTIPAGWLDAVRALPWLWALVMVGGAVALAAGGQLAIALGAGGVPAAQCAAVREAVTAGNYQGAWLACDRWGDTLLSRLLRPALERIGDGPDGVTTARQEAIRRERRRLALLSGALLVAGVALPLMVGFIAAFKVPDLARQGGVLNPLRAFTVAEGNVVLLLGAVFLIAAPATIGCVNAFWRRRRVLESANAEAEAIFPALPYEDLAGLRIGREFAAGNLGEGEGSGVAGQFRVSKDLTSACPQCSAPINPSLRACHQCHAALEWR